MTTWLNDKGPISCHGIRLDGSIMIRDESCIVFLLVSLFGVIGLVQVIKWANRILLSYQGLYHGYTLRSNMSVMSVWPGINGENGLSGLGGGASNQREMISVKRRMHVSLLMTNMNWSRFLRVRSGIVESI